MKIKRALKVVVRTLAGFVAFVLLYLFFAFAISRIAIPQETTSSPRSVPVYILMDGVHTDIVVPVKNRIIDWNNCIKLRDTTFQFIAFGWGDKNFYINTPTWSQLKFSTAFQAVFGLGTPAIHTSLYRTLQAGSDCKKIVLSDEQYRRLVVYIKSSFKTDAAGNFIPIKTNVTYGDNDAFFDANGRYSLFFTCNTWANNALKACSQKACLWTVFENGIAHQYQEQN